MDFDPKQPQDELQCPTKRAYETPKLMEFGNVRELTRGTSTKSSDFHATTRQAV
ncbi:MAG: lasso RiPP family leader peptide-containing protein [Polyangiaceae bacterium]